MFDFKDLNASSRATLALVALANLLVPLAHLIPGAIENLWLAGQRPVVLGSAELTAVSGFLFTVSKRNDLHRLPSPSLFLAMAILLVLTLPGLHSLFNHYSPDPAATALVTLAGLLVNVLAVLMLSLGLTSWSAQSLVFTRIYGKVSLPGRERPSRVAVSLKTRHDKIDTLTNRRGIYQFLLTSTQASTAQELIVRPAGREAQFGLLVNVMDQRTTVREDFEWI